MTTKTTKNTKTILAAGLLLTLVASLTTMNLVNAQVDNSDQTRVAMKKQKIADNFQQFVQIREKTDALERDLHAVEENMRKSNLAKDQVDSLTTQKVALKAQIDAAYQEIDRLEKISNKLHEIPLAKEKQLDDTVQQIIQKYQMYTSNNPKGLLSDVFINAQDETIYVLQTTADAITQDVNMQQAITDMKSELNALATKNNVQIVVSKAIDDSSCNLNSERANNCQPAASGVKIVNSDGSIPTTIGFKAVRAGVTGFVTVGHATYTLQTTEKLYQPTTSNQFGQLVYGRVDNDGNNDVTGECDCSFFSMLSGRTVDYEVVSNDAFNWPITERTATSNQIVGNFVYKSGIGSNITTGQITSKDSVNNRIYANYVSADTDSGAPVGKVLSGNFKLYGIHEGHIDGTSTSIYVPYDVVNSYLGPLS